MMQQAVLKREYVMEQFQITIDNIDQFEIMESRRQISEEHVSKIHGALLSGKNPIGVLIVNRRGKSMRLIDGNHRIEAIRKFFNYKDTYKKVKIDCILKVYSGLSDEEEREIYSDEARRRNESYEDRLNIYKDTITFWKLLNDPSREFPCKVTIYSSQNSLKFRMILNAILTSKTCSSKGYVPTYVRKESMVDFARELLYDDFLTLKNFIIFFEEVFGKVEGQNRFINSQYFIPLYDIYIKNIQYAKNSSFKERFSRILGRADLLTFVNMRGREAQTQIRQAMLDHMNKYVVKHKFI